MTGTWASLLRVSDRKAGRFTMFVAKITSGRKPSSQACNAFRAMVTAPPCIRQRRYRGAIVTA